MIRVRHARPDVPAAEWRLGDAGRAAARALAGALAVESPSVLTSGEPKALQTAEELTGVGGGSAGRSRMTDRRG